MAQTIDTIAANLDQKRLEAQIKDINKILERCADRSSSFAREKNRAINKLLLESGLTDNFKTRSKKLEDIHKIISNLLDEGEVLLSEEVKKSYISFAQEAQNFSRFFYAFYLIKDKTNNNMPIEKMRDFSMAFQLIGESLWDEPWLLSLETEQTLKLVCQSLIFGEIENLTSAKKNKKDINAFKQYKTMLRHSIGFILWRLDEHQKEALSKIQKQQETEKLEKSVKLISSWIETSLGEEEGIEECFKRIDENRERKLFEKADNNS